MTRKPAVKIKRDLCSHYSVLSHHLLTFSCAQRRPAPTLLFLFSVPLTISQKTICFPDTKMRGMRAKHANGLPPSPEDAATATASRGSQASLSQEISGRKTTSNPKSALDALLKIHMRVTKFSILNACKAALVSLPRRN